MIIYSLIRRRSIISVNKRQIRNQNCLRCSSSVLMKWGLGIWTSSSSNRRRVTPGSRQPEQRERKKNRVLRTRKSLGEGGDSDDDDPKPIKPPGKDPAKKKHDDNPCLKLLLRNVRLPKNQTWQGRDSDFEMKLLRRRPSLAAIDSDTEMEKKAKLAKLQLGSFQKPSTSTSSQSLKLCPKVKVKGERCRRGRVTTMPRTMVSQPRCRRK